MLSTACFSCREKYAVVEVETVDRVSHANVLMDVYCGIDNQFLGSTPSLLITLPSNHPRHDGVMSFVVKSNGYNTAILMGRVTKWASTVALAHDSKYINTFRIEVDQKSP